MQWTPFLLSLLVLMGRSVAELSKKEIAVEKLRFRFPSSGGSVH